MGFPSETNQKAKTSTKLIRGRVLVCYMVHYTSFLSYCTPMKDAIFTLTQINTFAQLLILRNPVCYALSSPRKFTNRTFLLDLTGRDRNAGGKDTEKSGWPTSHMRTKALNIYFYWPHFFMFSKQPSLPVNQVIGISSNAKKDQSYIIHAEGLRLTWSMPDNSRLSWDAVESIPWQESGKDPSQPRPFSRLTKLLLL